MPNMLDYLVWRGDLTVAQAPLNENDELILSQLAYVAFGDLVPGLDQPGESVALKDACAWLLEHDPDAEKIHQTGFMWEGNKKLMKALCGCARIRFGDMRLSRHVDTVSSEDEKQFAALTILPGDGSVVVAYRGTDDTLIGWKEDLNMALENPVPAQLEAVQYLERVAETTEGPIRVQGHSKGGNLAIYAAAYASEAVNSRVSRIISHDGPGQSEATIASAGYAGIRDRLHVFLPHFSFVGMLLAHEDEYTVVRSDEKTLLQHDAFSWQMLGTRMLYADAPSETSLETNRVLREWLATLTPEYKELFIEAVYEVAVATYGETIPEDVEHNWPLSLQSVFSAVFKLDHKTRAMFTKGLNDLFSTAIKNILFPWQRTEEPEKKEAPRAEKALALDEAGTE